MPPSYLSCSACPPSLLAFLRSSYCDRSRWTLFAYAVCPPCTPHTPFDASFYGVHHLPSPKFAAAAACNQPAAVAQELVAAVASFPPSQLLSQARALPQCSSAHIASPALRRHLSSRVLACYLRTDRRTQSRTAPAWFRFASCATAARVLAYESGAKQVYKSPAHSLPVVLAAYPLTVLVFPAPRCSEHCHSDVDNSESWADTFARL
mmetsp:Transcript_23227/g.71172  ORF Transcript_23227/g.71172 Transcript_23227/m.71172 type:complete len:207 (+) Transcript_23227:362-982(+)|eukprot:scaffold200518_cov28-Tisochrysis_lutea.AAC.1